MTDAIQDPLTPGFSEAYKSYSKFLKFLGTEESLVALWRYSVHLSDDVKLPLLFHGLDRRGMPFDINRFVYPWELEILAREVLLHSSPRGKVSLLTLPTLARAINPIKRLSSFGAETMDIEELMLQVHRLAHQQFPVQRGVQLSDLMRYRLIFENADVQDVFLRGIGIHPRVFFFLGAAVAAGLMSRPNLVTTNDYTPFGISHEERDKFFELMVISLPLLRQRILETQQFGRSWAYTTNPLAYTPLVSLDPTYPERVYGPIPTTVLRRVTSGVYYDLVKTKGFENAFGSAFENYIGLVLSKSKKCNRPWEIYKPQPYRIQKSVYHGSDWILSEGTASIFIECKAARITAKAKEAQTSGDVDSVAQRLANMVVQNYANISHALSGLTDWKTNSLPTYNLVATLEDFIAFGAVAPRVRTKVIEGLRNKQLPEELLETIPYFLVSASEFEGICSVLNHVSAFELFSEKNKGEQREWLFSSFFWQERYLDAWSTARRLHADEFAAWRRQIDDMSGGKFQKSDSSHRR